MSLSGLFYRFTMLGWELPVLDPSSLRSLCGILLCLCLDAGGLLLMQQQLEQLELTEQHVQQLQQQLATAVQMQPTAMATQQQLRTWQRLGLLNRQTPAQWGQRMQALQQQYQLPHVQYVLAPEQPWLAEHLNSQAHTVAGLNTRQTPLQISLTSTHEQAMEWWLSALQQSYPDGWQPVRCHWQVTPDAQTIHAECHLLWVSFLQETA